MTWIQSFLIIALAAVYVQGQSESAAKLSFSPEPTGTPPLFQLDKRTKLYKGPLLVTCDGTGNANGVVDIFLTVKDGAKKVTEEKLSNRQGVKPEATVRDFDGTLLGMILKYTMKNIRCSSDGLVFECVVAGVPNLPRKTVTKTLQLGVPDGPVMISPASNPNALHRVGDYLAINCFAVIAGVQADTPEKTKMIEWQFQKKDPGDSQWQEISADLKELVVHPPLKKVPCHGGNSSVRLPLTLAKTDHQRTYRCAYKNKLEKQTQFNYLIAQKFSVGLVREKTHKKEKVVRKVTYTLSSLIGMMLGITSFFSVSFLGIFYTYRKNRGGKKYDIVKSLLQQEEVELDKIEASLGMAAGKSGVSSTAVSSTVNEAEESSAAESSVVESEASSTVAG